MRAYIVDTGRLIAPFGEPPGDALFAQTTMGAAVRESFSKRGMQIVDVKLDAPIPASSSSASTGSDALSVVVCDHTFVSDKALGDFLDKALDVVGDGKASAARLALAKTASVDFTRPVSSVVTEPFDEHGPGARNEIRKEGAFTREEMHAKERVAYDCFLVRDVPASTSARAWLETLRKDAVRVVVDKREIGIPLRLPVLGDAKETRALVPITSTVAAHVEHWVHILWLNQLAFGIRWMEIARTEKLWGFTRALAAFPWTSTSRFMRAFVKRGKNVRIHPTAHVEASILGDNVVIGARASVRNCILGDGVEVGDHAAVLSCTLGDNVYVTPRTFVVWGAAYPDAVLTNYKLQVSLVGRGASLSTWAGMIDAKLQGTVSVQHDGKIVDTERSFIGSCIGHGAYVGGKVLIMPGRAIPNGAYITMRPDELIYDVPRDLPAGVPLVRDHGTLIPLDRLLPG